MRASSNYARGLSQRIRNQAAQPLIDGQAFGRSIDQMLQYRDTKKRQEEIDAERKRRFDAKLPISGMRAQGGMLSALASLQNAAERQRSGEYQRGGGAFEEAARRRMLAGADPAMANELRMMDPGAWAELDRAAADKMMAEVRRRAAQTSYSKGLASGRGRGKAQVETRKSMRDEGLLPKHGLDPAEDRIRRELKGAEMTYKARLKGAEQMGGGLNADKVKAAQQAYQQEISDIYRRFGSAEKIPQSPADLAPRAEEFVGPPAPAAGMSVDEQILQRTAELEASGLSEQEAFLQAVKEIEG